MSPILNHLTTEELKTVRKTTRKSGRVKRGGKPEIVFSSPTQPAMRAEILVRFRITPTERSMGNQSISYYPILNPIVFPAILGSIIIDLDAQNVAKLERNEKVNSAIDALLRRIRNELYFAGNTGNDSKTRTIRSTGRKSRITGGV